MKSKMVNSYLQDSEGNLSSKRLGFLVTIANAVLATDILLVVLIYKSEYNNAIEIVNIMWVSTYIFGGLVASEILAKVLSIFKK